MFDRLQRVASSGPLLITVLLAFAPQPALAKGPEPPRKIPLAQLGYQAPAANVLAGGGALSTAHFLDETHLLVTFNVRRLMKRMADCLPEDTDRTVEAVLVDLPGTKVLARTTWRIHDGGQYLWDLGGGRLLLRVRDTLTTVAPLENLGRGEAFAEEPFLKSPRRIAAVLLSPERDLVTVETVEKPARKETGEALPQRGPQQTEIGFYRVVREDRKVIAQAAGTALTKGLVRIPLNAAGYLEILQESTNRWLFDYTTYTGKHFELSPFDTTCRPTATFVNQAEFVALGCRGASDRLSIGGFNMRGEQMWQQDFPDTHAFPNYAFAPDVGRFALSRNIVSPGSGITVDFAPDAFTTQEIRVYQSYNGKQLLRAEASPVQRSGQNYDLSPEGLSLAVLRGDAVELYRLPELSKADVAGVKAARALAPAEGTMGPVNLAARRVAPAAQPAKVEIVEPVSVAATLPDKAKPEARTIPALQKSIVATSLLAVPPPIEPVEDGPRKAPTLYTLPGDKVKPQE